ncbi:cation:proton antiporter [Actinophytocola glycyrrhizae]|uniref:Cation:proton antiporter n=1 Tax=Actinophytocola glycyrrhizae TaxID=2044873 RepID=A0ABV9SHN0_9PSEU
MEIVAVFGVVLAVAVLLSSLAHRSVMSLPLLFLVAGVVLGNGGFGLISVGHDGDLVRHVAEVALFVVLFSDGMRVLAEQPRHAWGPPVRALLIGMPVTAALITLAVWGLTDLSLVTSALVGIVLSPTDPVLVSGLLRRDEVPAALRQTLNVESGINDGLALPGVLVLIAVLGASPTPGPWTLVLELLGGVALGVGGALVLGLLIRLPGLVIRPEWQPLAPIALAATLYGTGHLLHLNQFLAAFVGAMTLAALAPDLCSAFGPFGEQTSEMVKFFALLVFGALLEPAMVTTLTLGAFVVVAVTLFLARPAGLLLSLLGTRLPVDQRLVAAWFGPKGLASVLYGLFVLRAGIPRAQEVFALVALVVVVSVVLHTSTDVLVARRLRAQEPDEADVSSGTRDR